MRENCIYEVEIFLKNGRSFVVKCGDFSVTTVGVSGPEIKNIEIRNATANKPLYLNFGEVVAVVQR